MRTAFRPLIRDEGQRHQPPFPDPVTIVGLRKLINGFEPDVIHAYGWLAFSVAVALGRRRIPMLISARDYGYFCANRTLLHKGEPCDGPSPLKCAACSSDYYGGVPKGLAATAGVYLCRPLLARKMTGLHSVSTFVHDVTTRYLFGPGGTPEDLVQVTIPSFQDVAPDEPVDSADSEVGAYLERLPAEPFILYVGAFRKVKGLETLFDAYKQLPVAAAAGPDGDLRARLPADVPARGGGPHRRPPQGGDGGLGQGDVRGDALALAGALRRHRGRGDEPRQAGDRDHPRRPRRHDRR